MRRRSACVDAAKQLVWVVVLAAPVMPYEAIAQSAERSGKDVVEAACITSHGTGAQGAPKIGDQKAWSARASQGLTSLTDHALRTRFRRT